MSGKSSRDHEKKDGALFILALFAIIVIGFSFMFWEVAGDKVVDLMVPAVLFMGKMWKLLGDPGQATYLGLMDQAIAHLYEMEPDADILNLTDDQIANVMAYTVAFDAYNRVQLELGRVFEKLKYAPRLIQERLAQVLDYIMVVVNRSMEKVRAGGVQRSMREIAAAALQDALTVFAES